MCVYLHTHMCILYIHKHTVFLKVQLGYGDKDGGIKGQGAHPLPQIYKKYISVWNSSHRIPTEPCLKILHNQSSRKDHHVTG